jgi:hypothetical protein
MQINARRGKKTVGVYEEVFWDDQGHSSTHVFQPVAKRARDTDPARRSAPAIDTRLRQAREDPVPTAALGSVASL